MKKIIQSLAEKPIIFNTLRRIIEANYISLKKVIKKEFSLDYKNGKSLSEEKVLDIPCGTGEFCMLFASKNYYGLDISAKYVDYAKRRYNKKFFCCDARQSGFDDDYFDKILTIGFLHHLDHVSVEAVLEEMKRILKPDGLLLLIEDAPPKYRWNFAGKFLQGYDIGSNIRYGADYKAMLKKDFTIRRYYHVLSGFWDYSVFVLSLKK